MCGLTNINSCSCGGGQQRNQNENSKTLNDITSRTDTSHIYIGQGLYKNKTVGLKFEVNSNIPAGITSNGEINSKSGFVRNAVKFISIGQESDSLLSALSQLYNEPSKNVFTKKILTPTLFSLNQQDVDLDKTSYYKFKLFFNDDSEDEDSYAEIFFNINTGEKIIELHEKDKDYRKPLLKTFTDE
ncbi:MAG TPA: hypothetical protein VMU83_10035 [Hanamia sp.]|nr:hypothetical protein [Hanamia sp.]